MPYLITTSLYPTDRATQVAEKYMEMLAKYPPDENLGNELVPAAVKTTHDGVKVVGILEVKEGKLEEALNRTVNEMVVFLDVVGFEYSIDVYLKVEEALATIGMSMPK